MVQDQAGSGGIAARGETYNGEHCVMERNLGMKRDD